MTAGSAALGTPGGYVDHTERPVPDALPGRLPPEAEGLYTDLVADAEDLGVVAQNATENARLEREDLFRLRSQLTDRERQDPRHAHNDRDNGYLRRQIETATARVRSLNERAGQQTAQAGSLQALVTRIDAWLGENAHATIVPHEAAIPKLGRAETPAAAVERCRGQAADLAARLATTRRARLTSGEAKAAARAHVAEMACRARPDVSAMLDGGSLPFFTDLPAFNVAPTQFGSMGPMDPGGPVRDGYGLLCWLMPDAVTAALDREIDAVADDKRALTAEAKARQLATLGAELLAVERDEEAFLRMALAQGVTIERRPDADPRAVLQVATE